MDDALSKEFVRIAAEVASIDTRTYEVRLDRVGVLAEHVTGCALEAVGVLAGVSAPEVSEATADLAFMSALDLRQRIDRLARVADPWLVIAEAASIRRHVVKSLVRVEQSVCEDQGRKPALVEVSSLTVSLASRKAFMQYIHSIRTIGVKVATGDLDLVGALRLSATNVAKVIGRDVYEHLRVDDRRQLRSLQQRIFDAVRSPEDELGVRRLWLDIQSSAELFLRIHDRHELVQHDFNLLQALLSRPDAEGPHVTISDLVGRDPTVDEYIAGRASLLASRGALFELRDDLARKLGLENCSVGDNTAAVLW